jgi:hypothetical protein
MLKNFFISLILSLKENIGFYKSEAHTPYYISLKNGEGSKLVAILGQQVSNDQLMQEIIVLKLWKKRNQTSKFSQ